MGTEKDKCRTVNRNRPPPVPPRPLHLVSTKSMSKYSSMPDILNGWKKDANPDLLKLSNGALSSAKMSSLDVSPRYFPKEGGGGGVIALNGFLKNWRDDPRKSPSQMYRGNSVDKVNRCDVAKGPEEAVGRKPSRKFSCIPSRSNSKKKKNSSHDDNNRSGKSHNNRSEISQTCWYVEDLVGDTPVQLSKCEITLNCNNNNNCRYVSEETPVTPAGPTASITTNSFHRKVRYAKHQSTMTSSSSLSGLPPLPKSLSDASLLWDSSGKCFGPVVIIGSYIKFKFAGSFSIVGVESTCV